MEAMVAGRPVIAYEPEPYGETFDYDVLRIVPTFARRRDILELVAELPALPELGSTGSASASGISIATATIAPASRTWSSSWQPASRRCGCRATPG